MVTLVIYMIDLGFNVWVKNRIRFMGVDAWESRIETEEEKVKGYQLCKRFIRKFRRGHVFIYLTDWEIWTSFRRIVRKRIYENL